MLPLSGLFYVISRVYAQDGDVKRASRPAEKLLTQFLHHEQYEESGP